MRSLFCTIVFILAFAIQIIPQDKEYVEVDKFDPERDPFKDLAAAVAEASRVDKRIILDVGGDWCIWCKRIDGFIEENKEIKNYIGKHYIVMKINYSKENKNEKFLSQYPKIEGYPHFFVLDKNGKLLHSQNTGLLEKEKSYSKKKFMDFLKKWK